MNIMTRRGSLDNVVAYEHFCDTIADMQNIPQDQITLGSIALILSGTNNTLEVYMAGSDKQWNPILASSSSDSSDLESAEGVGF